MKLIQYTVIKTYYISRKCPSGFKKETSRVYSADEFGDALRIMPTQTQLMLEMCVDDQGGRYPLDTECEYCVEKEIWSDSAKKFVPLDKMASIRLSMRGRDALKGLWAKKYGTKEEPWA